MLTWLHIDMPNSDCYVPDFMLTCRNSIEIKQADENNMIIIDDK